MKPYREKRNEERRLIILQMLDESGQQKLSFGIVYNTLDELAIPGELADVNQDVRFLGDEGLIDIERVDQGGHTVQLLQLTRLGAETARGKRRHPGVLHTDVNRRL